MFLALGIFAVVFGLLCLLVRKEKWASLFKQANEAKGSEVYTDESIKVRIKTVKICGIIAVIAGLLLIVMEVTGF